MLQATDKQSLNTALVKVFSQEEGKRYYKQIVPIFSEFESECKFTSCSHINERDCGVKTALINGKIHKSRYQSYVTFYNEVKDLKPWNVQKQNKT